MERTLVSLVLLSIFFILRDITLLSHIVTQSLATFGALTIIYLLLDTIWSWGQFIMALLAPYFISSEETSLVKKFGPWALITGSTDGIGKAYAMELAKRGVNIVLVSRNLDKLNKTAKEIETQFKVKTKVIAVDFSQGQKAVESVKEQLGKFDIDILVNNVGMMYEYPMYLHEVPEADLWAIITINVGATTALTRFLVDQMKTRGRGAVVNVSSGSQHQPLPLMTVYAATKAYISNFSTALRHEYTKFGITVQTLIPMFVSTKMNHFSDKVAKTSLLVPDAESYAKYAVYMLGKMDQSSGYWTHGIQTFFTRLAPVWLRTLIGAHMNKQFRKEYLKNQNKCNGNYIQVNSELRVDILDIKAAAEEKNIIL